jgi:hypothetical protein
MTVFLMLAGSCYLSMPLAVSYSACISGSCDDIFYAR